MSEIRVNLLSDAAGTGPAGLFKQSAAKAWANLNGTGTIALRSSFGVSSVVDNGTGDYSFNLLNALDSANFAVTTSLNNNTGTTSGSNRVAASGFPSSASAARMASYETATSAFVDRDVLQITIHGDLA
jgi:hypothetical protein